MAGGALVNPPLEEPAGGVAGCVAVWLYLLPLLLLPRESLRNPLAALFGVRFGVTFCANKFSALRIASALRVLIALLKSLLSASLSSFPNWLA